MKKTILLGSIIIFIVISLSMVLYVSEKRDNPSYQMFSAVEDTIIVMTGEYPEKPKTPAGRIILLIMLIFSLLIFSVVTASLSSVFVSRSLMLMEKNKMKKFKDHIVICNWNKKGCGVVEQLIIANENKRDILIIHSTETEEIKKIKDRSSSIFFVKDDPTHHTVLKNIQAHHAKSVIILADEDTSRPDEKTALIALAIKHLETQESIDVHIVSELIDYSRRRHLEEAGVDEVVGAMDLNIGILAQSALTSHLSKVYHRLLHFSGDTNEIYFIEPGNYPITCIGKNFPELKKIVDESKSNSETHPLVLLGVKLANGEVFLNPRKENFSTLTGDDSLIIMAYESIKSIK